MPEASLRRLARAVADGAPVDWDWEIESAPVAERGPLRQLRLVAPATRVLGERATEETWATDRVAWLLQPALWVAAAQALLGTLGYLLGRDHLPADAIPPEMHLLIVAAFGGTALVLSWGGARDRRTLSLGAFFLLVAASFSGRLMPGLPAPLAAPARLVSMLPVDAFIPTFLWLFVWRFPETAAFSVAQALGRRFGWEPAEGDLLPVFGALLEGAVSAGILSALIYSVLGL